MVKRAQIQFICITMSILLGVFASIIAATYYVSKQACRTGINARLSRLELLYTSIPARTVATETHEGVIVIKLNDSDSLEVLDKPDDITDEQIISLAGKALENYPEITSSYFGKVYYRISDVTGGILFVAADTTDLFASVTANTVGITVFLLVLYLILAVVVWGFSFKVFQPIKISLYKQKKFISDASHELKTPVAVISANADVLKNKSESNRYIDSIKSQTKRLNLLVNDMLTLARMDEARIPLRKETFNLSDAVTETVLPFDAVAFENGKTLLSEIETGVTLSGDRESVKKIINILMDNAIKYSSKGGTIKVTLEKHVLTVSNSGSDIKDMDSDKVFERFFRGEQSRSRETGGSGLGLSIAKSIADTNKWNISAKSRFNESMTITIVFAK